MQTADPAPRVLPVGTLAAMNAQQLAEKCVTSAELAISGDQLLVRTSDLLASLLRLPDRAAAGDTADRQVAEHIAVVVPTLLAPLREVLRVPEVDLAILLAAAAALPQSLGQPIATDYAAMVRILLCDVMREREMQRLRSRRNPECVEFVNLGVLAFAQTPTTSVN